MKLCWLGQAGYRIVTENGTVIMIDPYLSDSLHINRGESYRREVTVNEKLLSSHVDVLIISHAHTDHMDLETLDILLPSNPSIAILASESVLGILRERYTENDGYMLFDPGVEITLNGIRFSSCFAAHSGEKPVGCIIEADGKVLCHTGDTMYHKQLLTDYPHDMDALLLPINGKGYNMNAVDAARLTSSLSPKAVLPMHWDMFKAYGCDHMDFINAYNGSAKVIIPKHYDTFEI